ncbi:hypothetical protein A3715_10430 [Oleiphilus sp. HI0009]|nr:hypothetical protein A3715_10430 [Oleiphilus sp. HI0009]
MNKIEFLNKVDHITKSVIEEIDLGDSDSSVLFDLTNALANEVNASVKETLNNKFCEIGLWNEEAESIVSAAIGLIALTRDGLSNYICVEDCGYSRWQQLEDNDWSWFGNELMDALHRAEWENSYLLSAQVINGSIETTVYGLLSANLTPVMKDMAEGMFAQGYFYGAAYDSENEWFDYDCIAIKPLGMIEISTGEKDVYKKLPAINEYNTIKDLGFSCHSSEVEAYLLDQNKSSLAHRVV